jgi:hypothetical protein
VVGSSSSGGSNPPPPVQADPITLTFRTDFSRVAAGDATALSLEQQRHRVHCQRRLVRRAGGKRHELCHRAWRLDVHAYVFGRRRCDTSGSDRERHRFALPDLPAPTSSHVVSENTRTSLDYQKFNIAPNEVIWDATHARLQIATRADSPICPSSLVTLDPVTGQITASTALDAEPVQIAVSANGQFVYAGFANGKGVRRYLAATLAHDIDIPVGTANARVFDIAVSPTSPRTIAVVVDKLFNVQLDRIRAAAVRRRDAAAGCHRWRHVREWRLADYGHHVSGAMDA